MKPIDYKPEDKYRKKLPPIRVGETERIREFLRAHDLTNPVDPEIVTKTRNYRYLAFSTLIIAIFFLWVPLFTDPIRRVLVGSSALIGGISLFFYSSIQTRHHFYEDYPLTIQHTSWALSGYIIAVGAFAYLLSGLSTFFYDYALQNPDLIGFTLINGIFSLVISWATSSILGPISSILLYLGLALLVFTGSIFLIIVFGGAPLLEVFILALSIIAGALGVSGSIYLIIGWTKDSNIFNQSLPIIRLGIICLKIIGTIWIIVSLMGDALFFSILLLGM